MSWGNPNTTLERIETSLLMPAALAYGLGAYCNLKLYALGLRKQSKLEAYVASIGNITCGGTGKTPMTIDLAKRFSQKGYRVGVLTRGYKRKYNDAFVIAGDGSGNYGKCGHTGDEPLLIAKSVPQAVVVVGADRSIAAQIAVTQYKCDLLLLDDGFQHFKIKRDADIVLLDYNDQPENDLLLPAGRLREPLTALSRAQAVVITKLPSAPSLKKLEYFADLTRKYSPHAHISYVRFKPASLKTQAGAHLSIEELNKKRIYVFSGIARPETFIESINGIGGEVVGSRSFSDHYWYSQKDLDVIQREAKNNGADMLVTTEKDMVKLDSFSVDINTVAIELETEWVGEILDCVQAMKISEYNSKLPCSGVNQQIVTAQ